MKYLIKNKAWKINKIYNIDKILCLLVDKPDLITNYHNCWYKNKDTIHRDYDLPARVGTSALWWCSFGKFHRENDKPAIIYDDGIKVYYKNGSPIKILQ